MKCFYHPEADSVLECRICGHPLCAQCPVDVKGAPYCQDCLQARLEAPATPGLRPDLKSPTVAGWLSVLPGLGLVYLGEYLKALVVWLVFIGCAHLAERSDIGGALVPFIWFAQIFYTVHECRRLNQRRSGGAPVEEPALPAERDSPIWGGILVGIGTLFLLDQFDLINFGMIFEKFWPLLIIALGIQILLRGRHRGEHSPDSATGRPGT